MSDFKEFQGKNLDEAIQAACDYYEVARAKLEIEIISGGSTGIFGLVGVRKASVKARPRRGVKSVLAEDTRQDSPANETAPAAPEAATDAATNAATETEAPAGEATGEEDRSEPSRSSRSRRGRRGRGRSSRGEARDAETTAEAEEPNAGEAGEPEAKAEGEGRPGRSRRSRRRKPRAPKTDAAENGDVEAVSDEAEGPSADAEPAQRPQRRVVHEPDCSPVPADRDEVPDFPPDDLDEPEDMDMDGYDEDADEPRQDDNGGSRGPSLEGLDQDKLREVVNEAVTVLLQNLTPEPNFTVNLESDRVHVLIDDEEHSGLIIGREGQTLSALQYLANRIVSRRMEASVRVQLDTGDYRERQDDKLRQQARRLADKAISSRRTQSTKPLSSYHRRVVHLTVQEMPGVLTRSKGEGPLKRVLIVPKKRSR